MRILRSVVVACAVLILIGIVVLWPSREPTGDLLGLAAAPSDARVTGVEERLCEAGAVETCVVVTVELTEGPFAGATGEIDQSTTTTLRVMT